MLIDNKQNLSGKNTQEITVYENLKRYLHKDGTFDFVTGYFTISALATLYDTFDAQKSYRIILGDLDSARPNRKNIIDLINQKHLIEEVFGMKSFCERAVEFLSQPHVEVKTVDRSFCHAKCYIYTQPGNSRSNDDFLIVGSSNFTEAGLGMRPSANIELNKFIQSSDYSYQKAKDWFNNLWDSSAAKDRMKNEQGQETTVKEYLIELIQGFFQKYTPREIYFKTLFELYKDDVLKFEEDEQARQNLKHLRNTVVFSRLYDFQQKGALSLIRMIQQYGGAILADAVGLGKTWTALAVMKYFELQGYTVLLLSPKKIGGNWTRYLKQRDSIFEQDEFDFIVRYHSDLYNDRMSKDGIRLSSLKRKQKLLIVIDESHNLRNDKSGRYEFLIDNFYRDSDDREIKTLLLSATPINNKLLDVRNQFKLIAKGKDDGFRDLEGIHIGSLQSKFAVGQKEFEKWIFKEDKRISQLRAQIPSEINELVDKLVVARTRDLIKNHLKANIHFPDPAPPENYYSGDFPVHKLRNTDEILVLLSQVAMTAYQPAKYIQPAHGQLQAIEDDRTRQKGVAKLMHILLIKRLESSWVAFYSTIKSVLAYHHAVLATTTSAQQKTKDGDLLWKNVFENLFDEFEMDDAEWPENNEMQQTRLVNKLNDFIKDLRHDCDIMMQLVDNFDAFAKKQDHEKKNEKSCDVKLEQLIKVINEKRKKNPDRKIIVFSVFRDTAKYVYGQLQLRGFQRLALVTGSENVCEYHNIGRKSEDDFEPVVERFAPYTKLFKEKDWDWLITDKGATKEQIENYDEWEKLVKKFDAGTFKALNEPIDLLIATDCLSEGQNLQDSDCLINYDIHWNPVRLIQRFGRIDRLGSKHKTIYGVNFWPAESMNSFLRLKERVEGRMAAGTLFGMEVKEVSESFKECLDQIEDLVRIQSEKMFRQLEIKWEDIETSSQSLGFAELSFEQFRQELLAELSSKRADYEAMPNGVYTGFNLLPQTRLAEYGSGLAGLLGYPARPEGVKSSDHKYEYRDLFFIGVDSKVYMINNMEVLLALREHKNCDRYVPGTIEKPNGKMLDDLKGLADTWMNKKFFKEEEQLLLDIAMGEKPLPKEADIPAERLKIGNYDLITWFVISKNKTFI